MTREEAIETLRANYPDKCYESLRDAVDVAIESLKAEPIKHGYWIHTGKERPGAPESIRCSECKFWYVKLTPRHYCSNCGAKMDLDEVGE